MTELIVKIIDKVRELCDQPDCLREIASKPARIHISEDNSAGTNGFLLESIGFGEQNELIVTNKLIYLTNDSNHIGKALYEYDGWNELLNLKYEHKNVTNYPVGRIEYLATDGSVGYSAEEFDADKFVATIKDELFYGVPIKIVLYRDADGNTISKDFLNDLDCLPKGLDEIDSPYL